MMFNFVRRIFRKRRPPTLEDVTDLIDSAVNDLYPEQSYIVHMNREYNAVDIYDAGDSQPDVRLFYTEIISYLHSVHDFLKYLKSKVKEKL